MTYEKTLPARLCCDEVSKVSKVECFSLGAARQFLVLIVTSDLNCFAFSMHLIDRKQHTARNCNCVDQTASIHVGQIKAERRSREALQRFLSAVPRDSQAWVIQTGAQHFIVIVYRADQHRQFYIFAAIV